MNMSVVLVALMVVVVGMIMMWAARRK